MIGTMLLNSSTGRYHPLFFGISPRPSSDPDDKVHRCRTLGHHTNGIADEEAARIYAYDLCDRDDGYWSGGLLGWDGQDKPVMTLDLPVSRPDEPGQPSRTERDLMRNHPEIVSRGGYVAADGNGYTVLMVGRTDTPDITVFNGYPVRYVMADTID